MWFEKRVVVKKIKGDVNKVVTEAWTIGQLFLAKMYAYPAAVFSWISFRSRPEGKNNTFPSMKYQWPINRVVEMPRRPPFLAFRCWRILQLIIKCRPTQRDDFFQQFSVLFSCSSLLLAPVMQSPTRRTDFGFLLTTSFCPQRQQFRKRRGESEERVHAHQGGEVFRIHRPFRGKKAVQNQMHWRTVGRPFMSWPTRF